MTVIEECAVSHISIQNMHKKNVSRFILLVWKYNCGNRFCGGKFPKWLKSLVAFFEVMIKQNRQSRSSSLGADFVSNHFAFCSENNDRMLHINLTDECTRVLLILLMCNRICWIHTKISFVCRGTQIETKRYMYIALHRCVHIAWIYWNISLPANKYL